MTALILTRLVEFLKLIPWWVYVVIAAVLYHLAAIHVAASRATDECNAKWQKQIATERDVQAKEVAELRAKQQEVITKTVIQYVDRVKVVHDKAAQVEQIIPEVIPLTSPVLSGGVRVVHDAAATGDVPDDPQAASRAAAPVETAALLRTVSENYESCRATRETLIALQGLVRQLSQ